MIEKGSEQDGERVRGGGKGGGGGGEKKRRREKEYTVAIGRGEYEKTKSHH